MADFQPLLAPGIHAMTIAELETIAVHAYPMSIRRPVLLEQFRRWTAALHAQGVGGRCWLDGSFLSVKPEPNDIDAVVFPVWPAVATPSVVQAVQSLFDNPLVKAQYGIDVYVVDLASPNQVQATSYWRGWYGFCRDGVTAKGIAEVFI
jgi:hypothetical protein